MNILALSNRMSVVEGIIEREFARVHERLDAAEIRAGSGKSTFALTTVTARGPDLRPLQYSVDKREIFDFENTVLTRREKDQFERTVRAYEHRVRELVQTTTTLASYMESLLVEARGAVTTASQALGTVATLCSALGVDLDVVDGQVTLSHVGEDVRVLALAGKVDRLKGDLEFKIRAEAGRIREELQRVTERASGRGV